MQVSNEAHLVGPRCCEVAPSLAAAASMPVMRAATEALLVKRVCRETTSSLASKMALMSRAALISCRSSMEVGSTKAQVMLKVQFVQVARPQLMMTAEFRYIRVTVWTARGGKHAQARKTDTTYLKGVHLSAGLILCILLLLQKCGRTCQSSTGGHYADLSMLGCFFCMVMACATQAPT